MRVLVVNTVTYCRNGITGVILNIYKQLNKENIQMDFLATDHDTEPWVKELIIQNGSKLYEIDRSYSHLLSYIIQVAKCVKGYDAIHIHGNSSSIVFELLAAKLAGVKKRIAHSHNTTCSSPKLDKLLRPLFYMLCNERIACGEDAGKWLFGHRKFWIINNGVDTEAFRFNESLRVSERKKLGISDEVLIGHVGRLNEQKNQTFLLDVFSELLQVEDNVKLLLIGDGPLEGVLKEKSTALNINNRVNFLGAVDNVNELINAVDLIVMPSLYEGLPLTLVEEQANGLVCIVSDSITREANLTGNLRFVSLDSPLDKWISIIQQEFSSENRKDLSEKGIQKIIQKGFDTSHTARIVEDIYSCE